MPPAEAPPRPDRPVAGRRTVVIRGQVAPAPARLRTPVPARRRPPRRPSERLVGARPDRAALWAVMMGVFLIVVALITAHGA